MIAAQRQSQRGGTQLELFLDLLLDGISSTSQRPFFVTCDSVHSFRLADRLAARRIPHIDVGVSEALAVSMAAGLATEGFRVYVAAFAAFGVLRGAEALRTFIDAEQCEVTIIGGMAGLSAGRDGSSHHMLEDLGYFRVLDGIRLYIPSEEDSCRWVVRDLLAQPGPAYVRLARVPVPSWRGCPSAGPVRWLIRSAGAAVVCGYGPQILHAAAAFDAARLPVGVLEIRRCQPLGAEIRAELAGASLVIVMEEHRPSGGLADRLREMLDEADVPVRAVGVARSPGSGSYLELLRAAGLAGPAVVRQVAALVTHHASRPQAAP